MALRVAVEAATAWAPFTFTWVAQRHAAALQQPLELKIADAEVCAKQAILVETGPEDAPSYGYVPSAVVRAALPGSAAPASPRTITHIVQLHPQGTVTLSLRGLAAPAPSTQAPSSPHEVRDVESVYSTNPALRVPLLKSASVARLLDDITHASARTEDPSLADVFLLTFRPYLPPAALLAEIRTRHERTDSAAVRQRLTALALRWAELHAADLSDAALRFALAAAAPHLASASPAASHRFAAVLQRASAHHPALMAPPPVAFAPPSAAALRATHAPEQLAEQLALIDHALLAALRPSDLQHLNWLRGPAAAPAMTAIAARAHALSRWTASMVLSAPADDRPAALAWLVRLLSASLALHNHAAAVGLLAGLQLAPVAALTAAWGALPPDLARTHRAAVGSFVPDRGWAALRDLQVRVSGAHVPYLGPLLAELVEAEHAHADLAAPASHLLNVAKLRLVAALLSPVHAAQLVPYTLAPSPVAHDHALSLPRLADEQLAALGPAAPPAVLVPWLAYLDDTARTLGRSVPPLAPPPPFHPASAAPAASLTASASAAPFSSSALRRSDSQGGSFGALAGGAGAFASASFGSRNGRSSGGSNLSLSRSSATGDARAAAAPATPTAAPVPAVAVAPVATPTLSSPPASPTRARRFEAPPIPRLGSAIPTAAAAAAATPAPHAIAQSPAPALHSALTARPQSPPPPPSGRTDAHPPGATPAPVAASPPRERVWTNAYDLMPGRHT